MKSESVVTASILSLVLVGVRSRTLNVKPSVSVEIVKNGVKSRYYPSKFGSPIDTVIFSTLLAKSQMISCMADMIAPINGTAQVPTRRRTIYWTLCSSKKSLP